MTDSALGDTPIAQPGSDLHYSLLGVAADLRAAIIACHRLAVTLGAVGQIENETAALAQYHWWQDELDRLCHDRGPRHPDSLAVHAHCRSILDALQTPFSTLLDAARDEQRYDIFPDEAALLHACAQRGGTLATVRAHILESAPPPRVEASVRHLGQMLDLCDRLDAVRVLAQRGQWTIPEQDLQQFAVSAETLRQNVDNQATRSLFAHQAARIRQLWDGIEREWSPAEYRAQRPQWLLARLRLAWLDEVERDGYRLLVHRLQLTPLRRVWLSARCLWHTRRD